MNEAQLGLLAMLNVSASPLASLALGVNAYAVPTVAVVDGVPVIVGGALRAETLIVNGGSDVDTFPSLTPITMLAKVPTDVAVGVPANAPVLALKVAHAGRLAIVNVSGSPLASAAAG